MKNLLFMIHRSSFAALSVLLLSTAASANPITTQYLDTPTQCVDPPNTNLTEELGPAPTFPIDERISIVVSAVTDGDCSIPNGGGDDYTVTITNLTQRCFSDVFVVADALSWVNDGCPASGAAESGAQCLNATDDDGDTKVNDGCPQIGTSSETVGAQCDNATDDDAADDPDGVFDNWDGTISGSRAKKIGYLPSGAVLTFELMNVPNVSPIFNSLGINSGSAGSTFSIVAAGSVPCPTVSEWGLVVMALLVVTAATIVLMRRRTAVA